MTDSNSTDEPDLSKVDIVSILRAARYSLIDMIERLDGCVLRVGDDDHVVDTADALRDMAVADEAIGKVVAFITTVRAADDPDVPDIDGPDER